MPAETSLSQPSGLTPTAEPSRASERGNIGLNAVSLGDEALEFVQSISTRVGATDGGIASSHILSYVNRGGETVSFEVPEDFAQQLAVFRPKPRAPRASFKQDRQELLNLDRDGLGRRIDGTFLTSHEEQEISKHEQQISAGLKGWLAECGVVTIDNQNRARDTETNKRLTNAQLLEKARTSGLGGKNRGGATVSPAGVGAEMVISEVVGLGAEPITDVSTNGLRGRLHRTMGRVRNSLQGIKSSYNAAFDKLTERIIEHPGGDLKATHTPLRTLARERSEKVYLGAAAATAMAIERAREYYSDQEHGDRRRAVAYVVGGVAVLGSVYLTWKGLHMSSSGNGATNETINSGEVPVIGGNGHHGGGGNIHEHLGGQSQEVVNDGAHPKLHHGQEYGVIKLRDLKGDQHDSIWRHMAKIAERHGSVDPSSKQFQHFVSETVKFNDIKNWNEVYNLPVGARIKIPIDILEELYKTS